jgi:DNA-binding GntR family transcriptional regulator
MQYITDRMPVPNEIVPLDRRSARHAVFDLLRSWIEEGTLEPGEIIKDSELALRLGVSRTPVREALQILEQQGLVEMRPGRLTRVTEVTAEDAALVHPPLSALEALAAELGTPRAVPAHIEALREHNSELLSALNASDPLGARDADRAFHGVLIELADNPYLAAALETLLVHARRLEGIYFRNARLGRESYEEHERIISAVDAGDAAAAAELTRRNFLRYWLPDHGQS